ncbi:MAG: SOS response-associated peptidase [Chitinophagales bacterium]|nr:SOS response-associated peptidase [Chitinophagales bacterium]
MCFHSKQSKDAQTVEKRFNAKFDTYTNISSNHYNGFTYPKTPVITNNKPQCIQLFNWGLIPFWAKDNTIRANTLNARIETITEKPYFKNYVKNRCLIIADGFFEWQWLDAKGKQKQQYLITLPNEKLFAFAGIFSEWTDQTTGEIISTYSIVTTEANSFMAKIHNTKKRMPVILTPSNERLWLAGNAIHDFATPDIELWVNAV